MIQAKILFHPVDREDVISRICYQGGMWAKLPMSTYAHVSLTVEKQIYELTWDGIALYNTDTSPRLVGASIPFQMEYYAWELVSERIMSLIRADVKLSVIDLLRMVRRKKVRGLLCTDFIEVVLGAEPSHLTPYEFFLKYQYLYGQTLWHNLYDMRVVPSVGVKTT